MVSVRGFTPEPRSRSRSSGVTGGKPTTPRDTREQGAQYNRQTTALRPKQPEAAGRRRGMQLQCNVVWKCSSQTLAAIATRLARHRRSRSPRARPARALRRRWRSERSLARSIARARRGGGDGGGGRSHRASRSPRATRAHARITTTRPAHRHCFHCSGNRANSIYNCLFARSRTPQMRKVGAWGVRRHVRSRLCWRFFGFWRRRQKKREKGDFVCKRCVLRTRGFVEFVRYRKRERARHSARFFARQAIISLPGGMRVHTRGLERPQLARHGLLSPVPTASLPRRRSLVVIPGQLVVMMMMM